MSYSPLKTGNWNLPTTVNNILSCLLLSEGVGTQSGLVGMCNVKFGNPLASGGQSSPKLTPTLSASSHMPERGILTRTYFVRDQVQNMYWIYNKNFANIRILERLLIQKSILKRLMLLKLKKLFFKCVCINMSYIYIYIMRIFLMY